MATENAASDFCQLFCRKVYSDEYLRPVYFKDSSSVVLRSGTLIKLGDYAHQRLFVLRPGKLEYFEMKKAKNTNAEQASTLQYLHYGIVLPENNEEQLDAQVKLRGTMLLHPFDFRLRVQTQSHQHSVTVLSNSKRMILSGLSPTGTRLSWTVQAKSKRDFEHWVRAIRIAMRPFWHIDTPRCQICEESFSFWNRRHHCRRCGLCGCWKCIPHLDTILNMGYDLNPVPVCKTCHPSNLSVDKLTAGMKVLVYGRFEGEVQFVSGIHTELLSRITGRGRGQLTSVTMAGIIVSSKWETRFKKQSRVFQEVALAPTESLNGHLGIVTSPKFVDEFSQVVQAANIIQVAVRGYLARKKLFSELHFLTCNLLEAMEEHRLVVSQRPFTSMSFNPLKPSTQKEPSTTELLEQCDFSSYHGTHIEFPLCSDLVIKLMRQFQDGVLLHPVYVFSILREAQSLFSNAPSMEEIRCLDADPDIRLTVVGDVHSQLEDLLTIFDINGLPSEKNKYLFNGDYVDRGSHGVEVFLLICCWKLLLPESVFVNRGNHECRLINEVFGFREEVLQKYECFGDSEASSFPIELKGENLLSMFQSVFNLLPLSTLVQNRILVLHGGLSSHPDVSLSHLKSIRHRREPPTGSTRFEDELFVHLLWSDPKDDLIGTQVSARGAGVEFGEDVTSKFCERNSLDLIIRSHECKQEGYEVTHKGKMITIFSASKYGGTQTNKGAYLVLNQEMRPEFYSFESQPLQVHSFKSRVSQTSQESAVELLKEVMWKNRSCLLWSFTQSDREFKKNTCGTISSYQWAQGLKAVVKAPVLFMLYYRVFNPKATHTVGTVQYSRFIADLGVDETWRAEFEASVSHSFPEIIAASFERKRECRIQFDTFQYEVERLVPLTPNQIADMFLFFDKNKTGALNLVDFMSFCHSACEK